MNNFEDFENCIRKAVKSEYVVTISDVFDWRRYIRTHIDLQNLLLKNGKLTAIDVCRHYLLHGINEHRDAFSINSNKIYVYDFDWKEYINLNPLLKFGNYSKTEVDAFTHWCSIGYTSNLQSNGKKKLKITLRDNAKFSADLTTNNIWKSIIEEILDSEQFDNIDDIVQCAKYKLFDVCDELDFSECNNINTEVLNKVNKNIDDFSNFIKPYKNILFICSDYPGYGGAATNCDNLSKYYAKTHNVYSIYWNYKGETNLKYECTDTSRIVDQHQLKSIFKKLVFKPDVVILKNAVNINLKQLLNCPVIFLIPGIYKNDLDVHYSELNTIEMQNKYINQSILLQICISDYTFCNSSHTKKILQTWFNFPTKLFYSTFIPYYKETIKNDPRFNNRKYQYGLIVSNFDRKIKNVEKSIEFLKDKENVILIGKDSSKYKSYGFTCTELIEADKMASYYKQIKYIVQDSYYESCSNGKVEGFFNGCKIYIQIVTLPPYGEYVLQKGVSYIIGNIDQMYKTDDDLFELFTYNKYNGYIVDQCDYKSVALFVISDTTITTNYEELIKNSTFYNTVVGLYNKKLNDDELLQMYYLYGKYNINKEPLGLSLFYDSYVSNEPRKYNRELFYLIHSYNCGVQRIIDYESHMKNLMDKDIFHKKTVLLISKFICGYGGVQKTSTQILCMLDKEYNVRLLSNKLVKTNIYDYNINRLNADIPDCFIVKITNPSNITQYINNTNFEFIINNKQNEILSYHTNKKIHFICHNSMDPVNNIILKEHSKIDIIFVVNQFHKNLLISNGISNRIKLYKNYVFDEVSGHVCKTAFHYNIGFIGRFSKDKNIQCVIDGVKIYNQRSLNKVTLYIIGDGTIKLKGIDNNIILTGKLRYNEIIKLFPKLDYLISASVTEGKPFTVIEAQSYGIPSIHSNINGIREIVYEGITGFTFDLENYNTIKMNMNFTNLDKINNENTPNIIADTLRQSYSINIDSWNTMSKNCIQFCSQKYRKLNCIEYNMNEFKSTIMNKVHSKNAKHKIFVNFKPNINTPYGGGNISVYYIINYLSEKYGEFGITYELEDHIKLYLIVDPFKDRNGIFKKYSLSDVVAHRNTHNVCGKIIIRINDCDKTRVIIDNNKSREIEILKYYNSLDFFIFNSEFIKNYYIELFTTKSEVSITSINSRSEVITNGCDQNIFKNLDKSINSNSTVKIVTHHWSDNMNKGYQTYYDLWKYLNLKSAKIDAKFEFIGKNVPEMFREVPIKGPFVKDEISTELNKYHIYITDSAYDSCPNHVIEAISCGLPVLYSNKVGGAKELCKMSKHRIGEMYDSFDDLIDKIKMIRDNYEFYRENIKNSIHLYKINTCISRYYNVFLKNLADNNLLKLPFENNVITINIQNCIGYLLLNDETYITLTHGKNVFALNRSFYLSVRIICENYTHTIDAFGDCSKLKNDKVNVLLCSDSNYYVGAFAALYSVIENTNYFDEIHFNFILPIEKTNHFSRILIDFEEKIGKTLNKTVVYIDAHILDPVFLKTTCYNGGGHLLNLGNLSRLLIGEFMEYDKLVYLDSDSIAQYDIIEPIMKFKLKYDLYSDCANRVHSDNKKQIVIKMKNIIKCDFNWKKFIGHDIGGDEFVYMGAPFITNCKKWVGIYKRMIELINIHNSVENGVYKLFTMSIQNILFHNKIGNIKEVFPVLQDLGSTRKCWSNDDLIKQYILDWSGIYKPWYTNGLYRNIWLYYDAMKLSTKYGEIHQDKNKLETNIDYNDSMNPSSSINSFQNYINTMTSNTNGEYNILYVCDEKFLKHKMSRVRFWAIECLGKNAKVNLTITGPGFLNFNKGRTLQQNIMDFNIKFNLVIWYKPLNDNYRFDHNAKIPYKTCLRYNEMWDLEWTQREINETKSDIIICHHKNDYLRYNELYKDTNKHEIYYIPHFANPDIFKPLKNFVEKDIDILISGVTKEKHYPLKFRLLNLINKYKNTTLMKYNIHNHDHPTYENNTSFNNNAQIEYNKLINRSKLCIACTSRHNYRLGKYVEIPMAGSVILGDLPFEDEKFKEFVVEVNNSMSDDEIINIIRKTLEDHNLINKRIELGLEWASQYVPSNYVDKLLKIAVPNRIFIISDEIRDNHPEFKNQKWICDMLKQEFMDAFPYDTTHNAKCANIIWYLGPWNYRYTPRGFTRDEWLSFLKTKKVVCTQHHIDLDKIYLGQYDDQFRFMREYGTHYHAICDITLDTMKYYFNPLKTSAQKLWANNQVFYHIKDRESLRAQYNFDKSAYLIGSFQKDTEGRTNLPKLSKGPDLFVKIVKDMHRTNNNVKVVLSGLRREYIIAELEKANIKYYYFNMIPLNKINDLYNCLDLYIVSSRCEGGPRSVFEAGLTKTPIISTRIGISPELMSPGALFDVNNWKSYKDCKPDSEVLYNNVKNLMSNEYMHYFKEYLLGC